jgi:signal transduction histidine kinase
VLARVRHSIAAHPQRTDAVVAALLAVVSLIQVLAVHPIGPRPVGAVVALGSTVPIAFRRSHPVAAAIAGTAVWLIPTDGYVWVGYIAAFILFYSLGAHADRPRHVAATAAFGVATSIVGSLIQDAAFGEYFGAVSAVAGPAVAGVVVRRLRTLTAELERERERSARAAVTDERARIARELHDVVAHGLSVIAIQADAAEAALDRDPALARRPLATIHASAREALAEMRQLLGVLRRDEAGGDPKELAPQPGLDQLPALVDRARAAGHAVELTVSGDPRPLPASLDLSAYRILQEALTNVHKHAPRAAATVCVDWRDEALGLAVRDGGAQERGEKAANGTGGGHGLVGMRERVRMHGGHLETGPDPDGGFAVRAELPL